MLNFLFLFQSTFHPKRTSSQQKKALELQRISLHFRNSTSLTGITLYQTMERVMRSKSDYVYDGIKLTDLLFKLCKLF